MSFGTNSYHFQLFRAHNTYNEEHARWGEVCPEDTVIIPTLRLLNAHPGLATRWCCSGHTLEEVRLEKPEEKGSSAAYVALAYTREGFEFLYRVHDHFTLNEHPRYLRECRLVFTNLMSDFEDVDRTTLRRGWEALILKFSNKFSRTTEIRRQLFDDFERVLIMKLEEEGIKIPELNVQ